MFQTMSVGSYDRVLRDVGFGALSIFATFLTIFLGAAVVSREVDRRTLHAVICKPVSRNQYVMGKVLGVWLTQAACVSLMFGALLLECLAYHGDVTTVMFQAFWLLFVEQLVVASFAVLGSAFLPTSTCVFLTVSMYFVGHMSSNVLVLVRKSGDGLSRRVAEWLFWLLPDLERFNLRSAVSHLDIVSGRTVISATAIGVAYAVAFTLVASAILQRRDLR